MRFICPEQAKSDPRTDIKDTAYWQIVLTNCHRLRPVLCWMLYSLRCGGAQLRETDNSYRLLPGEWPEAAWEEAKQHLLTPKKDDLMYVFAISRLGVVQE